MGRLVGRVPAALLLALTACSSNQVLDDTAADDDTAEVVDDDVTGSDTAEATGDGAGTTSVPAADEDAVAEVHTRFLVEFFAVDERTADRDALLELAEELTTGAQLQRIRDRLTLLDDPGLTLTGPDGELTTDDDFGYLVGPGYESSIARVTIDGDHATVLDCSLDRGEVLSADGEVLTPADETPIYRESLLVLEDGQWRISELRTKGPEPCDP